MLHLVRYEDGTDRCPDCAAIVPEPEDLEGGGILRRAVEHRAWCPRLRLLEPTQVNQTLRGLADVPDPAPGPIWSNSLAEDFDEADARRAARLLERFKIDVGQQWAWATLNYITADYLESGLDATGRAMLHLIAKEMHQ